MARRPDPIDAHVGSRLRLRRTLLGMSQDKLGQALSLTFQQIQKYERGANRIGAGRLYRICQILDVPVSFFYDDIPENLLHPSSSPAPGFAEGRQDSYDDAYVRRETLELVRAYYRITDRDLRMRLFDLVKAVAGDPPARRDDD